MELQELQQLIETTESDDREYKTSTSARTAGVETVCGMLNNHGGIVLFGVHDNGRITGQDVASQTLEEIATELQQIEPPAPVRIETVPLENGRRVIVLHVPRSNDRPHTYRARPFTRTGPVTSSMPQERYQSLKLTRFGGHSIIGQALLNRRCPDAPNQTGVSAGVQSGSGTTGPRW